jgi:hypothetical protein
VCFFLGGERILSFRSKKHFESRRELNLKTLAYQALADYRVKQE